jgi:hypothetical protein
MKKFSLLDIKLKYKDVLTTKEICDILKSWTVGKILLIGTVYSRNGKEIYQSKNSKNIKIKVINVIKADYRNYTFVDVDGTQYEPYYKDYNIIFDEEDYLDYLKEKEKDKEKYLNIDPFSEENWDD